MADPWRWLLLVSFFSQAFDEVTSCPACPPGQFPCAVSCGCIPNSLRCNHRHECRDRSDERRCDSTFQDLSCKISDLKEPHLVHDYCNKTAIIPLHVSVNVTCKTGYVLNNESNNVQCINGNWTYIPQCMPSCSTPVLPLGMSILPLYNKSVYLQGEQVVMKCTDGYFLTGGLLSSHLEVTCETSETWKPKEFLCNPKDHFRYSYIPENETTIEVDLGETLALPCIHHELPKAQDGLQWLWLKDSIDIMKTVNISYYINESNGSLILQYITDECIGKYTCLTHKAFQYKATSLIYYLKKRSGCFPWPQTTTILAAEHSSALMFCPNTASHILQPAVWYDRTGKRILNDNKFTLVLNTGLLVSSMELSDEGEYVCDVGPNSPFCDRRFSTQLTIRSNDVTRLCGLPTEGNDIPWLVTLWWDDEVSPFCYGVLVNQQWVVTTAFCLIGLHRKRNPDVFVKLGQQKSGDKSKNSTTIPVQFAKIHPSYNRRNNVADIGLVKLKLPVRFNKDFAPICLQDKDLQPPLPSHDCDPLVLLQGNVTGMGSLEGDGFNGDAELMQVALTSECQAVPKGSFCAKGIDPTPNYIGDNGSPFQVYHKGKMYLYGVFSLGERRSQTSPFDYFTDVTSYYNWIVSYTQRVA